MDRQTITKVGSPRLVRKHMSHVLFITSPRYLNRKKQTLPDLADLTYIPNRSIEKKIKQAQNTQIASNLKVSRTKPPVQSSRIVEKNNHSSSHFKVQSHRQKEQESTADTFKRFGDDDLFLDIDSISFLSLHEEQERVEEYEKKILEQKNTIQEQANLIAVQERQLREMKMKDKKTREQLQKSNIALIMSTRKKQEQQKVIEQLCRKLYDQRNLNQSLQFSIDSASDFDLPSY